MAEVFSAVQEDLERPVAIKMLRPWLATDPSFLARFQQEAKTLAAMHHEGLVRVIDLGKQDDRPYLVMERLHGRTLHERLHPSRDLPPMPLPEREAMLIAGHLLAALVYAHERHNVVHRDIKPANVFLCDETQGYQVKLMDFGIASLLDGPRVTQAGEQFGTPEYMCPEQIQGQKPTPQWDIYGVGILLYEMVCGDVPFKAETPIAVAHKHLHQPVPPLPTTLSPQLRAVINKALAKDPAVRFGSAREMLAALRGEINLVPPVVVAAPISLPKTPKILAPGAVPTLAPVTKKMRKPSRKLHSNLTLVLAALFTFLSISGIIVYMVLKISDDGSGTAKKKRKPAKTTQASGKTSHPKTRRKPGTRSPKQTVIKEDPNNNKSHASDGEEAKQNSQDPKDASPSSEEPDNQNPPEPNASGEEPTKENPPDPKSTGDEKTHQNSQGTNLAP